MNAHLSRFLRFQGVGALGIAVQLGTLALLKENFAISTAWAAALAVEIAVLHNFIWHERWTWRSAGPRRTRAEIGRLLMRFHLGAGGVSLVTNVVLTGLLADGLRIHYLVANLTAIAAAGLLNFFINEHLVFAFRRRI